MSAVPRWASSVMKQLRDWQNRLDQIDRLLVEGKLTIEKEHIQFQLNDGRIHPFPQLHMEYWRKRVSRLLKEADARIAAKDSDWFFWLEEYSGMRIETFLEDFDEQYTGVIQRGAAARKRQIHRSAASAEKKKQRRDETRERMLKGEKVYISERTRRRYKTGR